jgi:endonuclease YncB( thermonuclease family)
MRRTPRTTLLITIAIVGAWAIERWGPGLNPLDWSFGAASRECRVDAVLDGDSLRLNCQGKRVAVRLHCIDAPEKQQKPWGKRSREALKRLTPRQVELVALEKDRYGRTVGDVYTTDRERRLLNLEQVKSGDAAVYDRYCKDARFFRAEREARKARRGIWSKAGLHQTPWIFRRQR